MNDLLGNRRGMALLLTLLVISILFGLTVYFGVAMRNGYEGAANLRDTVRLDAAARSAFNFARAVLAGDGDRNSVDSLQEGWAAAEDLSAKATELAGADCRLEVTDQAGLLQINALVTADGQANELQRQIFLRFLTSDPFRLPNDEAETIVDAIKDWIDPDDEVTRFGAESAAYRGLRPGYVCRNAPVESLAELLLIQGITPELYYGSGETPGIAAYLTPLGNDGKVNINTAPPLVLHALSENVDAALVDEMVSYRQDPANDLSNPEWYKTLRGDLTLPGAVVASHYFAIEATATDGRMYRTIRGFVHRIEGKKTEILSWKVE